MDQHGFEEEFKKCSLEELIAYFNKDTGHNGWVSSRGSFLNALRKAFLATGLDCSDFITETGMSLKYPIKREGNRLIQVKENG